MKCPTCHGDCILPAEIILNEMLEMYMACNRCPSDPAFNKTAPFLVSVDSNTGRCMGCGKRHLDYVVGNVLTILTKEGLFPQDSALRDVGTPLISYGFNVPYPPRIKDKNLVLIMDAVTEDIAQRIIGEVPEIKGVIKRKGTQKQSIGILDTSSIPHTYELFAGCDMRCDIISSLIGELCIYKNQSKIHIEFNNAKIGKIEEMYLKGELENVRLVDAFCGPGTLGLMNVLAGARSVILNDAWLPALKNTILNIKVNSGILGVSIEYENESYNRLIGDEPVLIAKATGSSELLVYHGDARKLNTIIRDYDICMIDTFPSVDYSRFITSCRATSRKVVII